MYSFLLPYLTYWTPLGYILVFIGMVLEGDTILFLAAFLTHQGLFNFLPIFLTSLWGVVLGDNLWYSFGVKLKKSESSFLKRWAERITKPFDEHLVSRPFRTIFISKFTYGFNKAILLRAGTLNIKWKYLEQSDILATLLWILIVGGLGYFSSASFPLIKHYLHFGGFTILFGLIILFVFEYLITKKSKRGSK